MRLLKNFLLSPLKRRRGGGSENSRKNLLSQTQDAFVDDPLS